MTDKEDRDRRRIKRTEKEYKNRVNTQRAQGEDPDRGKKKDRCIEGTETSQRK